MCEADCAASLCICNTISITKNYQQLKCLSYVILHLLISTLDMGDQLL